MESYKYEVKYMWSERNKDKTTHWGPVHNHVYCEMFVALVSMVCCGIMM